MDRFELQKLRELPIEAVAERLGIKVTRHRSLCCFHNEHTASLCYNVAKNTFRCFSCGAHGGVIDLAMHMLGKPFADACRWLADENNIILTEYKPSEPLPPSGTPKPFDASRYQRHFEHPWLSPDACRFLFGVRHLHPAVVRFCRLNSFRDWLQIPYYNQQGELIGIQRRYMGTDPSQPRFRFQQGESCHLYNQQVIPMLQADEPIHIAEGPSDTWALLSSGRKAVGIPSATLVKPNDLLPLAGREVHMFPDADPAGESAYQKLVSAANDIGFCLVRHDLPEGCKDFSDYWVKANS